MAIYLGKGVPGEDGFEMKRIGMYVSPCGRYWSNMPFPKNNIKPKPRSRSRFHN